MKKLSIIFLTLLLFITPIQALSATKFSIKYKYKDDKQYAIIYGKSSKNKTVWKYKTKKHIATELDAITYGINGKYLYIFEDGKLIKIKKSNGKIKYNKKLSAITYSTQYTFDKSGNIYTIGYYSSTIYKISPKGKVIWKYEVTDDNYYLPTKLKVKGKTLTVNFEGGDIKKSYIKLTTNGKFKSKKITH